MTLPRLALLAAALLAAAACCRDEDCEYVPLRDSDCDVEGGEFVDHERNVCVMRCESHDDCWPDEGWVCCRRVRGLACLDDCQHPL